MTKNWKLGINWDTKVVDVFHYYEKSPWLKYGPYREDKAFSTLDQLCTQASVAQKELMKAHGLSMDGVMTILSNVTKVIHGKGKVPAPEDGGWYAATTGPYTYEVSPGFSAAWRAARSLSEKTSA